MNLFFPLTLDETETDFLAVALGVLFIYVLNKCLEVGKGFIVLVCHENVLLESGINYA